MQICECARVVVGVDGARRCIVRAARRPRYRYFMQAVSLLLDYFFKTKPVHGHHRSVIDRAGGVALSTLADALDACAGSDLGQSYKLTTFPASLLFRFLVWL